VSILAVGGIGPWDGAEGVWLRCQLHAHTTESDGWLSPAMLRRYHATAGYDVLAITDHDRLTEIPPPHAGFGGDDGLVVLPGTELSLSAPHSGGPLHLLGIGVRGLPEVSRRSTLAEAAAAIRAAGGLAYVAHPWWSGHWTEEFDDFSGVSGIEVFNAGCEVEQGRGNSEAQWDAWLAAGYTLTAIATDDLHTPGYESFRAWTMVHAAARTPEAVLAALAAGRAYATTGPRIQSLSFDGAALTVRCTPARSIAALAQPPYGTRVNAGHHALAHFGRRLPTTDGHHLEGQIEGDLLTGAHFPAIAVAENLRYVRVVVTDERGRQAWTNPVWLG
jgi:hypothetical protein